jgi:uncharacterized protein
MRLLARIRGLGLPQGRLVAGCLYQTVWNILTGRPRGTGIQDYDLICFDAGDLSSADEALDRYGSVVHAVGVRLEDDERLAVAAPFGLGDLFAMVIRPNRTLDNAVAHAKKAQRARAIWPEVTIRPWDERGSSTRSPSLAETADTNPPQEDEQ